MMDKTAIMIILDESPSMENARSETVQGFNIFLKQQQGNPKPATLSLLKFDRRCTTIYVDKPLAEVPELTLDTYKPGGGGTALFDSVGRGIVELGESLRMTPEAERPDKVLFVVITDGEENASKEFNRAAIVRMIKEQTEKYGWSFVFMGADINAQDVGGSMGFIPDNIAQYSKDNVKGAYAGLSGATSRSRDASQMSPRSVSVFNADDRSLIEDSPKPKT